MNTKVDEWKEKRQMVHGNKRFTCDREIPTAPDALLSNEQVEAIAKTLAVKAQDRLGILRQLRNTFGHRPHLITSFLKVSSALPALMTMVTGNDTDLQLEGVACLTNMAAAGDDDVDVILKAAAPYLVTFLGSSNPLLQSQCVWATGNLVADSDTRASHMVALGVLHHLVLLLQSNIPDVVRSTSFALTNFARIPKLSRCLLDEGVLPAIERQLGNVEGNHETSAQMVWTLFYLSASADTQQQLRASHIPERLTQMFVDEAKLSCHKHQLLAPIIRCLAHLTCDLEMTLHVCQHPDLMTEVGRVVTSAPEPFIRKEALWLLTNIAASTQGSDALIASNLLPHVVSALASTTEIRIEACHCLCNVASQSFTHRDRVMLYQTLESVTPLLSHPDSKLLATALCLCEILLSAPGSWSVFMSRGGKKALEDLTRHTDCQLSSMATDLLCIHSD